jgi:hypothetical protein
MKIDASFVYKLHAEALAVVVDDLAEADPDDGRHVVPGRIRRALAEMRLLHSVPFSYLVADASMLPTESIRFFYLDRNWTDALIAGALSVSTFTSADRTQLESLYPTIRDEIDEAERVVRRPAGEERLSDKGGMITGFLMRSKVVSGWPGLHVRAYAKDHDNDADVIPESHPDRLKVLRMERLAPAVLLVLFDGVPEVVHIEEPRQGIQFGALRPVGEPHSTRRFIPLRNAVTGADLPPPNNQLPVPFRRGSPGVLNLAQLRRRMAGDARTGVGNAVEANEFALQMLRFPFRQVFGDPEGGPVGLVDVFQPTISFAALHASFKAVIDHG